MVSEVVCLLLLLACCSVDSERSVRVPPSQTSRNQRLGTVLSTLQQLVRASRQEISRGYTFPEIEENGTVHFMGVGGHLIFKLFYGDPSQTKLKLRKELLTVEVPLKMEDLLIEFEQVRVNRGRYRFDNGLKINFPKAIGLVLEIVVTRVGGRCNKDIFDVILDRFDFEVSVADDIKNSFKVVSLHMWNRIMMRIRRMIEVHTLYIFRKTFESLGPSFGQELCNIKINY